MSLTVKDQLGRVVRISKTPKRIISLVPSQTELLYDLGLDEEVAGITKFCVHPEKWLRSKVCVGGTKHPDLNKIRQLSPDLIIGNKEENVQEEIELLMNEFPVWLSDIRTLNDALQMIETVGAMTGKPGEAATLAEAIHAAFITLEKKIATGCGTVLYFIWHNPWMGAGGRTFIDDMLRRCGFQNVLADQERYPEIDPTRIALLNPSTILLSSEPYPFSQKHAAEISRWCPNSKVIFVDGEMFSWYGSRLLKGVAYYEKVIEQIHSGC